MKEESIKESLKIDEINENKVESLLIKFINEMFIWENNFNNNYKEDEELKKDLIAIFDTYCIKNNRKYDRPNVIYSEDPPEYDIENTNIDKIEVNKNKYIIYLTQKNKFNSKFRFFISYKSNTKEIKIEKKKNGIL